MRTRHTRTAAAIAAVAAGVLAAMSLRPSAHATATLAARNPAIEVRTEVIRRTVHVPGRRRRDLSPARGRAGSAGLRTAGAAHGGRTRVSGSHRGSPVAGSAAHPVSTRTSPGHSAAPTSSAPAGSGAHPVATRTSPGHSAAGGSSSSGRPVSTHASGSHHGDDGGDGHGDD